MRTKTICTKICAILCITREPWVYGQYPNRIREGYEDSVRVGNTACIKSYFLEFCGSLCVYTWLPTSSWLAPAPQCPGILWDTEETEKAPKSQPCVTGSSARIPNPPPCSRVGWYTAKEFGKFNFPYQCLTNVDWPLHLMINETEMSHMHV